MTLSPAQTEAVERAGWDVELVCACGHEWTERVHEYEPVDDVCPECGGKGTPA